MRVILFAFGAGFCAELAVRMYGLSSTPGLICCGSLSAALLLWAVLERKIEQTHKSA